MDTSVAYGRLLLTGAAGASLLMLDEEGRFVRGLFTHETANIAVGNREAEIILERGLAAWVVHHRTAGIVVGSRFANRSTMTVPVVASYLPLTSSAVMGRVTGTSP